MSFDIKRCLVVCTVGDRKPAIAPVWDSPPYSVAVINYGSKTWHPQERRSPGYKWHNIDDLLSSLDLSAWDYFWFPDDDNEVEGIPVGDAGRLFLLADRHGLGLCQPSMSADSTEIGWDICRHVLGSIVRRTNFVEIMCPLFSRYALEKCRPTFKLNYSGWGLDFLWPRFLGGEGIGVIDAVQVRHTEPGASPNWRFPNGKTSFEELTETLAAYGLNYEQCRREVGNQLPPGFSRDQYGCLQFKGGLAGRCGAGGPCKQSNCLGCAGNI